jgi:CheY-like chemotaxis protein
MIVNAPDRRSKIVLAVDDEPDNIVMLQSLIEGAGYTFFAAASGTECLTLVTRVAPRVILLDVQMPGIDGYDTCRHLRRLSSLDHVPIVFLTTRKTSDDVQSCMRSGGNDFIVKPFDPNRLIKRLEHWVGHRI